MDDARIQLILELAQSSKNVDDFVGKLKGLKTAGQDVAETYEVLAVAGRGYDLVEDQVGDAIEETIRDLERQAVAMEKAAKASNATGAAKKALKTDTDNLGYSTLVAAQTFQDFTSVLSGGGGFARALGSIQNNIPQLLAALGLGAGLAGAVSLVSVGVGVLIDNWDKLAAAFTGGATKEEAEAMEKLAEATKKANEQAIKMAEDVESDETTKRKRDVRQALVDYGGSKKLLDDLSKGNDQDRIFFANEINEALKGNAGSAKLIGLQNSKFGQLFGNAQAADDIKADEAENERRVKKREDDRKQAQKEDEAENERRTKKREDDRKREEKDQERQEGAMQKAVDKYADGVRNIVENGPLEAFGLGQDFRDYAEGQGVPVDVGQMKTAGKQIQDALGSGVSKDEAMLDAMNTLLGNLREVAGRHQAVQQQVQQIQQDADTVPTLLDWGW